MTYRFASLARLILLGASLGGFSSVSGAQTRTPAQPLPTQPLPTRTLACFYELANYGGASFCLSSGASGAALNSAWAGAKWDKRISSLRVQRGVSVDLYSNVNFLGSTLRISTDTPDLTPPGFNDLTSSFRVSRAAPVGSAVPARSVNAGMPASGVISYWQPASYDTLPANSVALINPNDGVVGADQATIDRYRQIVKAARSRGIKLLVYVPTGYGLRDPGAINKAGSKGQSLEGIKAQISAYASTFGADNLYGVFFDQADYAYAVGQTACELALSEYPALSAYVRGLGLQVAAWNTGWVGNDYCYVTSAQRGDIVVTFERDLNAYLTDRTVAADLGGAQGRAAARGVKTWHLIHSAAGAAGLKAALDLLRERQPDFAYVTDIGGNWRAGDNTWGSPPGYWEAEKRCLIGGACP